MTSPFFLIVNPPQHDWSCPLSPETAAGVYHIVKATINLWYIVLPALVLIVYALFHAFGPQKKPKER